MAERENDIVEKWIDPDEIPEMSDEWFAKARTFRDGKLVRRGRPPVDNPKRHVSIRLDPDVIEYYRAGGAGWQTRVNDALRKAAGL